VADDFTISESSTVGPRTGDSQSQWVNAVIGDNGIIMTRGAVTHTIPWEMFEVNRYNGRVSLQLFMSGKSGVNKAIYRLGNEGGEANGFMKIDIKHFVSEKIATKHQERLDALHGTATVTESDDSTETDDPFDA